MTSKNRGYAAGLAGALDVEPQRADPPPRLHTGILAGRNNRLAELASGAMAVRATEYVDPARCRMWSEHNRDYQKLNETRCSDLIESFKAQGRQEVPAIVRRISGEPAFDFEVVCGARRHWTVSWLRANNYADFRFLIEIRELTDEEAFRISDLENRAREDLSDIERARDYLRALGRHYNGHQKAMALRLNVTESWLSRYLDLARLPEEVLGAFPDPHALKIKHVTALKPLFKPDSRREKVLARGQELRESGVTDLSVQDVIRSLAAAADAPKRSGKGAIPRKSDPARVTDPIVTSSSGRPVLRVEKRGRSELTLTLLLKGGGSRADAEAAIKELLAKTWPPPQPEEPA